jgi:Chaperone of endosialidase
MKSVRLGLIGALALAGTAYAQVPATNDTSDEYDNTGVGTNALTGGINSACQIGESSTSKCYNTAVGYAAVGSNTTGGNYNTGIGFVVLYENTSGFYNTASGAGALEQNTTGDSNTAIGFGALSSNILGNNNTRSTGSYNTASGAQSLYLTTTGSYNVASGYQALYSNTTGLNNTATGYGALYSNINGVSNVASGYEALYSNSSGLSNTATGVHALANNTTGSSNTGVGYHAGANLTTGSNNIDIGSPGTAGDNNTIKIGVQGTQTAAYIAGIYGHSLTGSEVVVTSSGELGVVSSSERFKTAIAPMGSDTAKLGQLRPVTFKLKADATGTRQYGLIAEEVAKVYPELVIRNEAGRIDGVRYDELAPMLLNEVQKQAAEIRDLKQQQKQFVAQAEQLRDVQQQLAGLHAALANVKNEGKLVAQR